MSALSLQVNSLKGSFTICTTSFDIW